MLLGSGAKVAVDDRALLQEKDGRRLSGHFVSQLKMARADATDAIPICQAGGFSVASCRGETCPARHVNVFNSLMYLFVRPLRFGHE